MTAIDQLWEQYRTQRDPAIRSGLIGQYLGLVHHVVRQIAANVGDAVGYEDLVSAGMVGLVVAFEAFDLNRGTAFSTYATQRIRGAVMDELRAADPRTRLLRTRARALQQAEQRLRLELNRTPQPEQIAAYLGIDLATYWEWKERSFAPVHLPIDSPTNSDPQALTLGEILPAEADPPDAQLLADERLELLKQAIETLPEQQRIVLSLCYFEELSLRQIAEVLHLTESRISQIRTAALQVLRQDLLEQDFR